MGRAASLGVFIRSPASNAELLEGESGSPGNDSEAQTRARAHGRVLTRRAPTVDDRRNAYRGRHCDLGLQSTIPTAATNTSRRQRRSKHRTCPPWRSEVSPPALGENAKRMAATPITQDPDEGPRRDGGPWNPARINSSGSFRSGLIAGRKFKPWAIRDAKP